MSLTYNQFEVLTFLERRQNEKHTQRLLADKLDLSVGTINKITVDFLENAIITQIEGGLFSVTNKGYSLLEPYKVKRAVFIAAGFGSRMVPITLNTPKPLVLVHGKRIIETLLDAVVDAGITEVVLVRGYLKEQFDVLLQKYPNITFIDNPLFNEANNISSAYLARHLLQNAYILESDLLLSNKNLIRKYEYTSNYIGCYVERTDDWCFKTKNDIITEIGVGGEKVHHMFGISYWTEADGKKLCSDIETVFNAPGGKERYWDEVALRDCKKNYQVMVRNVTMDDIVEIDSFKELKQIDPIYNC